jgi:hypothetical protein
MNTTRNFTLVLVVLGSLLVASPSPGAAAQKPVADPRTEALQNEFLTRLASGNEEDRLDALARIGGFWRNAPEATQAAVIDALGKTLQQDPSPIVRALAARALESDGGNAGNNLPASPLIAALRKERAPAVRKAIIYALAGYAQPQVTAALIPVLEDKSFELRAAATFALAESGDPSSLEPLTNVLKQRGKEEGGFARSQAARGLGRLGNRDSIDPLLDALANDNSQEVRREAARALGRIATSQDLKVLDALRLAALAKDPFLVQIADGALEEIKTRNP